METGIVIRNCRSKRIGERIRKGRKLEYGNGNNGQRRVSEGGNRQNNILNRNENLIVLD